MSKLAKALTAAAGNAGKSLYVEDVFSTYLYEGNGAARTIDNNIALSDEGGLVWLKQRGALDSHVLFDTVNGPENSLSSNSTDASSNYSSYLSFPSAGTTGWNLSGAILNGTGTTWASWTFRKAEKFFDVVTYTGTGVAQTIAHNLGSVPACMIIKRTDAGSSNWYIYHIGIATPQGYEILFTTNGADTNPNVWNNTAPTDSVFSIGAGASPYEWNASGGSYVAYLFASDAGGFGDDGSESIIKCGSFSGGIQDVDLGFEPQFLIYKRSDSTGGWGIFDVMRGMTADGVGEYFHANTSAAEATGTDQPSPIANGFRWNYSPTGETYIYIAIRRPMKTPESGTEVFAPSIVNLSSTPKFISGFPVDAAFQSRVTAGDKWALSRLTGDSFLKTNSTDAEVTDFSPIVFDYQNGYYSGSPESGSVAWMFKRATGFFDVVAYEGDGTYSGYTVNHNLGVTPELLVIKSRSATTSWRVQTSHYFNSTPFDRNAQFNTTNAMSGGPVVQNVTSTGFEPISVLETNGSGSTYIAYLFATLAGISKVGSYSGTGSNVDVDCGFSAGARFILIKRTDSSGDWYVWDSERGIVAGNDPYLLLNSTAAEVTSTDYIDPLASGFTVTSSAPAALNASGGSYIFLAIA